MLSVRNFVRICSYIYHHIVAWRCLNSNTKLLDNETITLRMFILETILFFNNLLRSISKYIYIMHLLSHILQKNALSIQSLALMARACLNIMNNQ